jgi:hypothetical protein
MCQATLVGSSEGRAMAGELNRAILVMFAAPYAVFGTVLAVVFRRPLRERAAGFGRRLLGVAAPVIKLVPRRGRPHSDA